MVDFSEFIIWHSKRKICDIISSFEEIILLSLTTQAKLAVVHRHCLAACNIPAKLCLFLCLLVKQWMPHKYLIC
jgi:hypothetical protein